MSKRDERLVALEEAVKSAESKLKKAEMSVSDISERLETSEKAYERKFEEKSAGYLAQSGAIFTRSTDNDGKVTYGFQRETTEKEQNEQRRFVMRRRFNPENGRTGIEVKITDGEKLTFDVKHASQLVKPEDRKKFIAYSLFGYRKLDISTEARPFFKTVGAPIVVPVHTAKKLYNKLYGNLKDKCDSLKEKKVVKIASKGAEVAALPVILPAKFVKDIYDKGGVIHAVKDVGDKIQIDVIHAPKPVRIATMPARAAGKVIKNAALGAETAAVKGVKETEKYTIEIAKEKIYDEINKCAQENDGTKAAFVIGMKSAEIYKILHEHSKFRRAVRRDKAGDDITDVNVSLYLADKEEKKYAKKRSKLEKKTERYQIKQEEALAEYEEAKERLEEYKQSDEYKTKLMELTEDEEETEPSNSETEPETESEDTEQSHTEQSSPVENGEESEVPNSEAEPETESDSIEPDHADRNRPAEKGERKGGDEKKSKEDKKIDKTKKKLKKVADKNKQPVANLETTFKRFDNLAVNTATKSLRLKAMRDGNDNTAVEASNAAIVAAEKGHKLNKEIEQKRRDKKIGKYERKVNELENKKKINNATKLHELEEREEPREWLRSGEEMTSTKLQSKDASTTPKTKLHAQEERNTKISKNSTSKKPRKKNSATPHDKQKAGIKKRQHQKAHKNYVKKKRAAEAKNVLAGGAKAIAGSSIVSSLPFLVVIVVILGLIGFGGAVGGTGVSMIYSTVQSQCSLNDLGKCDRYYTELAKNIIERHKKVPEDYRDSRYSKLVCKTTIDNVSHSPDKLLAYLDAKLLDETAKEKWKYDNAVPYIEELFNSQYEFFTEEVHEIRTSVTTYKYSNEDEYYYPLGSTVYKLDVPEGVDLGTLKSEDYKGNAHTYEHIEYTVREGIIFKQYSNVGQYTDADGNKEIYDDTCDKIFWNHWKIELVFDWDGVKYREYWRYTEERQDDYFYDYWILNYGIREKPVTVDSSFYDEIHKGWEDTTFDKLVYNRVMSFETETAKEQFGINCDYLMGHQFLKLPFSNPVIKKYAGYDTRIDGDMSLEYSMELETYAGQEIICGMDGKVNILSDRSFSVYNKEFGTLYYEYVTNPTVRLAKKGEPIAKSQGDTLRITFIDNNGNYINPLLIFS